jgi:putative ABC transport system substrate-binding protein
MLRRPLLAAIALATPRVARAQHRRRRILMLLFRGWEEACDGFRDYLAARRLDVELVVSNAEEDLSRVPEMVRQAQAMQPDLVYLWGTSLTMTALGPWDGHDPARHLHGMPAVFNIVTDPVRNRVVRSRAAPGRPVTGTEYIAPVAVQLRAMETYRPFRRAAALFNPRERNSVVTIEEMGELLAARGAAFERLAVPVVDGRPQAGAIPALVGAARRGGAQWLYIPPDTFLNEHRAALTAAALQEGLPSFAASERFVVFADALAGLVSRYYSVGAFTGFKAEQILFGGRAPESIPVETLSRFSYLVRMQTARRLRAYPPIDLLRIAEAV